MAVRFRIDQATPGQGEPDQSRHDLIAGEAITLVAIEPAPAPGITYAWEILDRAGTKRALNTTTGSTVTIPGPTAAPFAFLVELRAYSNGSYLGAARRVLGARSTQTKLRLPMFGESADPGSRLSSPLPEGSTDNAQYEDLAGQGAGQNWRGWAQFLHELVLAVETAAGAQASGDATSLRGQAIVSSAPSEGNVLTYTEGKWAPVAPVVTNVPSPGGDVSGALNALTVIKLRGRSIATEAPVIGQVLTYDGDNQWRGKAPTVGALAGDVAGNPGSTTVERIRGRPVASTAPQAGQVLGWGGSTWLPVDPPAAPELPEIPTAGTLQSDGDVTGPLNNITVRALRNRLIDETAPSEGQVLAWHGTGQGPSWRPTTLPSPATFNVGGDATGTIANLSVTKLRGRSVASTAPAPGQVLTWVEFPAPSWAPVDLPAGTGGEGGGGTTDGDASSLRTRPVASTAPQPGDALIWTGTAWTPSRVALAGAFVDPTPPEDGQVLTFVAGEEPVWAARDASGGGAQRVVDVASLDTPYSTPTNLAFDILDPGADTGAIDVLVLDTSAVPAEQAISLAGFLPPADTTAFKRLDVLLVGEKPITFSAEYGLDGMLHWPSGQNFDLSPAYPRASFLYEPAQETGASAGRWTLLSEVSLDARLEGYPIVNMYPPANGQTLYLADRNMGSGQDPDWAWLRSTPIIHGRPCAAVGSPDVELVSGMTLELREDAEGQLTWLPKPPGEDTGGGGDQEVDATKLRGEVVGTWMAGHGNVLTFNESFGERQWVPMEPLEPQWTARFAEYFVQSPSAVVGPGGADPNNIEGPAEGEHFDLYARGGGTAVLTNGQGLLLTPTAGIETRWEPGEVSGVYANLRNTGATIGDRMFAFHIQKARAGEPWNEGEFAGVHLGYMPDAGPDEHFRASQVAVQYGRAPGRGPGIRLVLGLQSFFFDEVIPGSGNNAVHMMVLGVIMRGPEVFVHQMNHPYPEFYIDPFLRGPELENLISSMALLYRGTLGGAAFVGPSRKLRIGVHAAGLNTGLADVAFTSFSYMERGAWGNVPPIMGLA